MDDKAAEDLQTTPKKKALYQATAYGIIIGMKSYPSSEDVLTDIGEKPVAAFALSVTRTRKDLARYRAEFPHWVAEHSERGLANWINDRLWAHLIALVDQLPGVDTFEKGPTREISIGSKYRFRVKRHDAEGRIASVETLGFIEFTTQDAGNMLPGLEQVKLTAGYEWDKTQRAIGEPVVSLRDGRENIIWQTMLPEVPDADDVGGSGNAPTPVPDRDGPVGPVVDISERIGRNAKETAEDL